MSQPFQNCRVGLWAAGVPGGSRETTEIPLAVVGSYIGPQSLTISGREGVLRVGSALDSRQKGACRREEHGRAGHYNWLLR